MRNLLDLLFHVYFPSLSSSPKRLSHSDQVVASYALRQTFKSCLLFYLLLSVTALRRFSFSRRWAVMVPQSILLGVPCASFYLNDLLNAHLFFKVVPKSLYFDKLNL